MKELKIGEEIRIRCVEGEGCEKCICEKMNIDCPTLCSQYHRTDHKDVHFEIVENPHKELIDKACEWLKLNCHFWYKDEDEVIDIFRKAMEG